MKKENEKNRGKELLGIIKGFLLSEVAFQDTYKKYQEGTLRFTDIGNWVDDKGQTLLYNLKEQCHSLFRFTGKGPIRKNEWLLDLAIGSIFHEAMKLRENIYQLEVYRPKYVQYKSTLRTPSLKAEANSGLPVSGSALPHIEKRGLPSTRAQAEVAPSNGSKVRKSDYEYEKDYLQRFERIISKAAQGLEEGMEETQSLFRDAMAQLLDFFKENAKNPYLVRFLLERQSLLQQVYGTKKAKEVFDIMFKRGLVDAYYVAGRSYLTSEHYDLSIYYFAKALKMEPNNQELRFFLDYGRGMNAYYQNAYSKALSCFAELVRLKLNRRLKREYLKKAEEVCYKVSSELREEKKVKTTVKCRLLADQIKKMLS